MGITLRPASGHEVRDGGGSELARLGSLGLLRPGVAVCALAAPAAQDLERIARSGAALVLSPRATLAGGAALPPPALLPPVTALGCDQPQVSGVLDVLEEARTAALLGMPAAEALRGATLGGATALGLQRQLGSLEAGKIADLTCIDLSSISARSYLQLPEALLFGATRADVSDVWCAGRAAVSEHRLLAFDPEELAELARHWARRLKLEAAA